MNSTSLPYPCTIIFSTTSVHSPNCTVASSFIIVLLKSTEYLSDMEQIEIQTWPDICSTIDCSEDEGVMCKEGEGRWKRQRL